MLKAFLIVHCRIGSLENSGNVVQAVNNVHCRIGSLETTNF